MLRQKLAQKSVGSTASRPQVEMAYMEVKYRSMDAPGSEDGDKPILQISQSNAQMTTSDKNMMVGYIRVLKALATVDALLYLIACTFSMIFSGYPALTAVMNTTYVHTFLLLAYFLLIIAEAIVVLVMGRPFSLLRGVDGSQVMTHLFTQAMLLAFVTLFVGTRNHNVFNDVSTMLKVMNHGFITSVWVICFGINIIVSVPVWCLSSDRLKDAHKQEVQANLDSSLRYFVPKRDIMRYLFAGFRILFVAFAIVEHVFGLVDYCWGSLFTAATINSWFIAFVVIAPTLAFMCWLAAIIDVSLHASLDKGRMLVSFFKVTAWQMLALPAWYVLANVITFVMLWQNAGADAAVYAAYRLDLQRMLIFTGILGASQMIRGLVYSQPRYEGHLHAEEDQ